MGAVLSFSGPPHRRRLPWGAGSEAPYVLCLLPGHGHQGVSSAPRAARFASCPWLESICYRRRTRALKSAAVARRSGGAEALDSLRSRNHDGVANVATRFTLRRGTFINVYLLLKGPSTRSRCAGNWGSSEPGELRFSELGELRTGGASTRGATNRGEYLSHFACMFALSFAQRRHVTMDSFT